MNLRSVDLNLLVAFDALVSERHVSKAAERTALSQPGNEQRTLEIAAVIG